MDTSRCRFGSWQASMPQQQLGLGLRVGIRNRRYAQPLVLALLAYACHRLSHWLFLPFPRFRKRPPRIRATEAEKLIIFM